MSPKVFFVTGTSTGFGAEYIKKIIAEGDHAIATARNSSKLEKPKGATNENYLAVDLDVTKKDSINAAFKKAIDKFGRLDVVVNKCVLPNPTPHNQYRKQTDAAKQCWIRSRRRIRKPE